MPSSKPKKDVNDLATLFLEVAAEADGWDPSKILAGTNKKLPWKCLEGHRWNASSDKRTVPQRTGCPVCAESGYEPSKSGWFYLMQWKMNKNLELQIILKTE